MTSQTSHKPAVWRSLTSIRLALVLLLILAAAAVIGTVLPQEQHPAYYQERFGPQLAWLITTLQLSEVYRSPWFLGLIALLMVNLVACSVNRLPQAWRLFRAAPTWESYASLPVRARVRWPASMAEAESRWEAAVAQGLGHTTRQSQPDGLWRVRSLGRAGHLGPYLIHLGIILIILGGVIGKFGGVKGRMSLSEGETLNALHLESGNQTLPLPFEVRLDAFTVDYYADGVPKEYRSDLTFIQDGKPARQAICRVNHPVTFGGMTFYQSTYQTVPKGPVRLEVEFQGKTKVIEAPLRTRINLPEADAAIIVLRVDGNLQGLGPAVQLAYRLGREHPEIFWLLKNRPEHPERQPGPHRFKLAGVDFHYSSGLLVKRDPGVWWVYGGFLVLLPGFWLAFFTPRQRWAISLKAEGKKGWIITIHGVGDRHREAFDNRLAKVQACLEEGRQK